MRGEKNLENKKALFRQEKACIKIAIQLYSSVFKGVSNKHGNFSGRYSFNSCYKTKEPITFEVLLS